MHFPWFKRNGLFFIPTTIFGWMILLISLIYAIYSFVQIDNRSHSVSDTLINFAFKLLIINALYSLIAYFTTRNFK